jgi:hypothetical protein
VFGFCDIRRFTDTTEVLQEGVMEFVNVIAHLVHSAVAARGGAANKNIGDAFLLVCCCVWGGGHMGVVACAGSGLGAMTHFEHAGWPPAWQCHAGTYCDVASTATSVLRPATTLEHFLSLLLLLLSTPPPASGVEAAQRPG